MTEIPRPKFDHLSNFNRSQLRALEITWEWILEQPEWGAMHPIAKQFLHQISDEIESRIYKGDVGCPRCGATVPYIGGGSRSCNECWLEFEEVYQDDDDDY